MRVTLLAALVAFLIDRLSKFYLLSVLELEKVGHVDVFPPWIQLRLGWNQGVNFGLLSGDSELLRWGLISLSVAIAGIVFFWSVTRFHCWIENLLAGMLVGGAIGNAIDRIHYGAVVDFLNMACCGIDNPFVFNLGDVAIVGGAFGLAIFGMSRPKKVE